MRNLPYLLAFLIVFALAPDPAAAEDSRAVRAREIRDEILLKRKDAAAASAPARRENPFEAEVTAARERLAQIDAQIEEKRRHSESLAAPREKLAARSEELQAATTRLQEQNRARVEAIYRSAKLGAGAAGWHPEPARSARLSRYLASVAAVQNKKLETVEVEHGSAIAALDLARADDAAAAAELRVLDADRAEAEARLERAVADAGRGSAAVASLADPTHDPGIHSDSAPMSPQELAMQQAALEQQAAEQRAAEQESAEQESAEQESANREAANREAANGEAANQEAAEQLAADDKIDDAAAAAAAADESARKIAKAAAELAARAASAPVAADQQQPEPPQPAAAPELEPPVADEPFAWPAGTKPAETASAAPGADAPAEAPSENEASTDASTDAAVEPGATEKASPPRRVGILSRIFGNDRDSDSFAASRGKLPPPVAGKVVANYGQQHKSGATYRGVILRAGHDAPVKAVAGGQVSFAGDLPGLGNTVIVSHGGRYHTVYARLGAVRVQEGQDVTTGAELGELPADNADMHFELRDQGKAVDPLPWLKSGIPGAAP